jgi:hypothetical protein
MMRAIDQRLRKLEAEKSAERRLHIVWSNTSDPAEWGRLIAERIARGDASPDDEFMRIGWLLPHSGESTRNLTA